MERFDVAVVGGGILGLATAYLAARRSRDTRVLVLEKEESVAQHQSGRNSGVVHSGVYYRPGSLKATNCRRGRAALIKYCESHNIPLRITGKLVLATVKSEIPDLEALHRRGLANGVDCELLTPAQFAEVEPAARGEMALHVKDTGVVDFERVCQSLSQRVIAHDGRIAMGARVTALRINADEVAIETTAGEFLADHLVNCAGLHADRIARLAGEKPPVRIVPFRGEYYRLAPEAEGLVRSMIYPLPDPDLPFLGPHLTRKIDGSVEIGPNAVPAFAREGYRLRDISPRDMGAALATPGFAKLAVGNLGTGLGEIRRSISKRAFLAEIRHLVPELGPKQIERSGSGVRAQAVGRDGKLVDDFVLVDSQRATHVLNAPSPAATAALSIADQIVSRLAAG